MWAPIYGILAALCFGLALSQLLRGDSGAAGGFVAIVLSLWEIAALVREIRERQK